MEYDYYKREFTKKHIKSLLKDGSAILADSGGLPTGNLHEEGGIKFIVKQNGRYYLDGELEAYEFILNAGATFFWRGSCARFHNHLLHVYTPFEKYKIPDGIKVIDTTAPNFRYLVFEQAGFSIINKYSTTAYLSTLNDMNKAITIKYDRKGYGLAVDNLKKKIDVYFYNTYETSFMPVKNRVVKKIKNYMGWRFGLNK